MIPYALLFVTVIIAAISIVIVLRAASVSFSSSWHRLALAGSIAAFIYLYGAWVFLSVYMGYVFAVCFTIALAVGLLRKKRDSVVTNGNSRVFVNVLFSIIFCILSVLYFTGTVGRPYGIARLKLPFRQGRYYVFQGGKGLPTNVFHYGLRGAVYAMDIVKLNAFGNRASHIFSPRLEDYEIFNDTVYSPCAGMVKHTANDNPNNIPPARERGPTNTNHVLIETDSMYVFLGHLGYHKVFVQAGDTVSAGQALGLAGNSGFSIEPHLHIQVHAKTGSGLPWYKEKPLWIEIGGRGYLLFQIIIP